MPSMDRAEIEVKVTFDLAVKSLLNNSNPTVSFCGTELGKHPERVQELVAALKESSACITLDISNSGLTDQGVQFLAAGLAGGAGQKLKTLNLSGNSLATLSP